jgi:hypothetical protein
MHDWDGCPFHRAAVGAESLIHRRPMSRVRHAGWPRRWERVGHIAILIGVLSASASTVARAQIRVGPSLGYEFDDNNYFVLFAAEARATLNALPIELDPRFTFQPLDGTSLIQVDLNALYDLPLARTSTLLPYAGVGIAIQHVGNGGGTSVGYNLIWGTELHLHSPWQPFAQFQYSVIMHEPNPAVISVGALFTLGGKGSGAK